MIVLCVKKRILYTAEMGRTQSSQLPNFNGAHSHLILHSSNDKVLRIEDWEVYEDQFNTYTKLLMMILKGITSEYLHKHLIYVHCFHAHPKNCC